MSDTSYSYHNRIMNIQSDTTDMEGDVTLDECGNEVEEHVREFLYERLKDDC